MAAPLSDIAVVTVTSEGAAVTQAGFGTPIILSVNAAFAERVRTYSSLTELAADFDATDPEYLAATEMFSQEPRPEEVKVGRLVNKPTPVWTITPTAVNDAVYSLEVDGVAYSFTADSTATAAEIVTGLKAALAVSDLTEGGTTTLTLTGNAAGVWHAIESTTSPIGRLTVAMTHTTSNISDDLDAIALEDSDFYAIINLFNSTADAAAIATWAQANSKVFICQTQETNVIEVSSGSDTTSVAYSLKNSNRTRTMLMYHGNNGAFLDAAIAGRCLPEDPGTETWAHKQLTLTAGASSLTSTQRTNLRAKKCGFFETIGGVGATFDGKTSGSSDTYMDVIRLNDETRSRIEEALVNLALSVSKIPYTNAGIFSVGSTIKAVLERQENKGAIAQGWVVTVPDIADVPTADKTARELNGVKFDYTVTGAIQSMDVSGTASV